MGDFTYASLMEAVEENRRLRTIMDYEIMRLECLKLATSQGFKGADAVKEAERMMAYCRERGTIDKLTDMAVKARVVGRDGDFEKPFRDYIAPKKPD